MVLSLIVVVVAIVMGMLLGVHSLSPVAWVGGQKRQHALTIGEIGQRPWEAPVDSIDMVLRPLPEEGVAVLQKSPAVLRSQGASVPTAQRSGGGTDLVLLRPLEKGADDVFRVRGAWVRGVSGAQASAGIHEKVPTHAERLEGHAWIEANDTVRALVRTAGGVILELTVEAQGYARVVHAGPRGSLAGPGRAVAPAAAAKQHALLWEAAENQIGSRRDDALRLKAVHHPKTRAGQQASTNGLVRSARSLLRHPVASLRPWKQARPSEEAVEA